MMAPKFERARVLHAAIETATNELNEPLDRIEVTPQRVLVWAGRKCLALKCYYANRYGPDGTAMAGGGEWIVEKTGFVDMPLSLLARVFAGLRRAGARNSR